MNQPKTSGNDFRTAVDELKNELDMAFLGEMLPARIAADHMTSLFSSMFGGVGALHDHLHLNGPEPEIRASELFTATTQPNDQSIYYFFKQLQSGMPWELPVNQFVAPVAVAFRLFDTLDERFPSPAATDARHVLEHLANLIGCPVERPGLSAKERQLKRERFFGEVHLCETKLRDAFEALSQYFLGLEEPFLCHLVPQLIDDMGEAYPEIAKQQKLIESVIREEEMAFLRTLDRGIKFLNEYMSAHNADADKAVSGVDAFTLYDTYGFPIDLTQLIASENGFNVDMDGFNVELQKQKERARNATANEFGDWEEYFPGESKFIGYDKTEVINARLLKHRTVVQKNKEMLQLVFNKTPFYGEMGGEVGDTGYIVSADGEQIKILNTVKDNNLTVHIAERLPKNCNGEFTLVVDAERRQQIANNHSATHLLDQALREILGSHVEQKGSYVCEKSLRFDFSHFEKLSEEQIAAVEARVNELIREDIALEENRNATMEQAREMGAIALFGEKYGEFVRVVKFGPSVELCGGCHTRATGTIGLFKILSESAIAAGVRRIEAVTGVGAAEYVIGLESTLKEAKGMLGNPQNFISALQHLIEQNAAYKKQADEDEAKRAKHLAGELAKGAELVGGVKLVKYTDSHRSPVLVRTIITLMQKDQENMAVVGAFEFEGKPNLVLMYTKDLVAAGKNAGQDIRNAAKFIQGGGGGQPGFASAGGKDTSGLKAALDALIESAIK